MEDKFVKKLVKIVSNHLDESGKIYGLDDGDSECFKNLKKEIVLLLNGQWTGYGSTYSSQLLQ